MHLTHNWPTTWFFVIQCPQVSECTYGHNFMAKWASVDIIIAWCILTNPTTILKFGRRISINQVHQRRSEFLISRFCWRLMWCNCFYSLCHTSFCVNGMYLSTSFVSFKSVSCRQMLSWSQCLVVYINTVGIFLFSCYCDFTYQILFAKYLISQIGNISFHLISVLPRFQTCFSF